MSVTLYGLKTCDSCRKARRWLAEAGIEADFVDLRAQGVEPTRPTVWAQAQGWQTLFNRNSRTWRQLDAAARADLNQTRALELMTQYPTLIKRPVLEHGTDIVVGFSGAQYQAALAGTD